MLHIFYLHHENLICKSKRSRVESVNKKVAAVGFEPATQENVNRGVVQVLGVD